MNFGRVITAMATPFDEKLEVDHNLLAKLANHLIDNGNDAVVVSGTTGETPTLNKDEKVSMFGTAVDALQGKAPVIAGTGSYSTHDSIELSKEAEKTGVDGLLLVVPYYNKPPQYALYNHFKSIAEEVNIPVILYNVPGRTVRNLEPETVIELSKIDNIVGLKQANGNLDQVSAIKEGVGEDFKIYSGEDSITLPMLSVGGHGVISVSAHIVGNEFRNMINAYVNGNPDEALRIHLRLNKVFKAMFLQPNPIPLKYALSLLNWDMERYRAPLYELCDEDKDKVKSILQGLDIV